MAHATPDEPSELLGTEIGPACPLSGTQAILIGTIKSADLALLYKQQFRMNVTPLFAGVESVRIWRSQMSDLVWFDPPVTGDASFYGNLAALDWYYEADKYEFRVASDLISSSGNVLEVGCGPGYFGDRIGADRYIGLETSPAAVARARARGLDIRTDTIEAYAAAAPESADFVVSFQVLEHVATPDSFLRACVQALRPGGTLLISVPHIDGFVGANLNDVLNLPPHHVTWWSRKCLSWCAQHYGLELKMLHVQKLSDGPHRRWYCKNLIDRALLSFIGIDVSGPVVTAPLWFKLQPLSNALAGILEQGYDSPHMEPPGHTIIAAYRKPD